MTTKSVIQTYRGSKREAAFRAMILGRDEYRCVLTGQTTWRLTPSNRFSDGPRRVQVPPTGPPAAPRTARTHAKSRRGSVSWFNGPSRGTPSVPRWAISCLQGRNADDMRRANARSLPVSFCFSNPGEPPRARSQAVPFSLCPAGDTVIDGCSPGEGWRSVLSGSTGAEYGLRLIDRGRAGSISWMTWTF